MCCNHTTFHAIKTLRRRSSHGRFERRNETSNFARSAKDHCKAALAVTAERDNCKLWLEMCVMPLTSCVGNFNDTMDVGIVQSCTSRRAARGAASGDCSLIVVRKLHSIVRVLHEQSNLRTHWEQNGARVSALLVPLKS